MAELVIQPKNSLLKDKKFSEIKGIIVARLQEFPNITKYKFNNEFLSLSCSLIEHLVKKKYNINKKELLLEIFETVYPELTTEDKQQISANVEYLFDNKQINKVSSYKLFKTGAKEWFKRKFL